MTMNCSENFMVFEKKITIIKFNKDCVAKGKRDEFCRR